MYLLTNQAKYKIKKLNLRQLFLQNTLGFMVSYGAMKEMS